MTAPTAKRSTIRQPKDVTSFCRQVRVMAAYVGITQIDLAEELGGFRNDTLSRIFRGVATSIPVDLICALTRWADQHGFEIRWLLTGRGPMRQHGEEGAS